jgi:hypothetical protein
MNYRNRITIALVLSLALNGLLVALPWPRTASTIEAARPPLIFTVSPPEPESPRPRPIPRVVETIPSEPPDTETALLSDADSVVRGESGQDEDAPSPLLDQLDAALSLPRPAIAPPVEPAPPATPAPPTEARPPSPPAAEPAPKLPLPPAPDEMRAPQNPAEDAPREESSIQVARAAALPAPPAPDAAEEAPLSRHAPSVPPSDRAARPPAPLPAEPQVPEAGRSDLAGVTIEGGYASFSALRDEVAAYILYLKPLIRQEWLTLLLTRYSGVSPTEAMVRVGITPSGEIALLEIVGAPSDRIFATLCKESIRKAGPFRPFPFKVPPEFQDENLLIRWNFRFL